LVRLSELAGVEGDAAKVRGAYGDFCRYLLQVRTREAKRIKDMVEDKLLEDLEAGKGEVLLDHMGDLYRDTRQYEKAEEVYEYIGDNWPGSKWAVEAQKRLARMAIICMRRFAGRRAGRLARESGVENRRFGAWIVSGAVMGIVGAAILLRLKKKGSAANK